MSFKNSGFIFLMILVVLVTYKDIAKFGDQILASITGIFQ